MNESYRTDAQAALLAAQSALARAHEGLTRPLQPDRMTALTAIREAEQLVREALDHWVSHCRYLSDGWTPIGRALGISKQAAMKRWRDSPGNQEAARVRGYDTPGGGS